MNKLLMAIALAVMSLSIGCSGAAQRHAETEWAIRKNMPNWNHAQWNNWEAELASALDMEEPDPPMFPDEDETEEDQ